MLFGSPLGASFLRPMQPMQLTAQLVYLAFIRGFLALGNFDKLEHFLHVFHNALQLLDNLRDFVNCLGDGGGPRGWSGGDLFGQFRYALHQRQGLARRNRRCCEFSTGLDRFGYTLRLARLSTTAATPPPTASSASGRRPRPSRLRLFWILFSVFSHVHSQHERARFKWKGQLCV